MRQLSSTLMCSYFEQQIVTMKQVSCWGLFPHDTRVNWVQLGFSQCLNTAIAGHKSHQGRTYGVPCSDASHPSSLSDFEHPQQVFSCLFTGLNTERET